MAAAGRPDRQWPDTIVPLGRGDGRLSATGRGRPGIWRPGSQCPGRDRCLSRHAGHGGDQDGDVAVIVGSSTCHLAQSKTGVFGSGAAGCYPDATVEASTPLEAGQTATGSILDWYRRHFAGTTGRGRPERRERVQVLDELAAGVAAGSEGLVVRDDWQGNRSPFKNPQARGRLPGCRWPTAPATSFEPLRGDRLRHAAHSGRRLGAWPAGRPDVPRRRRREIGPVWLQIHADILKKPDPPRPARPSPCAWARRWPRRGRRVSIPTSTPPRGDGASRTHRRTEYRHYADL